MSKKDLKDQIKYHSKKREGTKVEDIKEAFHQEEDQKPHTLTIRPSYVDKIKDYVYMKKTQGLFNYTQGDAVETALTLLFEEAGDVPSRPEHIRQKEKRRTGRRKKSSQQKPDMGDPFS